MDGFRASERLDSWKEIAEYLKKGERTVRRWEGTEGLPVHRHQHEGRSSVYAFPAELDAWLAARECPSAAPSPLPPAGTNAVASAYGMLPRAIGVAVVVGLMAAGTVYYRRTPIRSAGSMLPLLPLTSLRGQESFPSFFPDGRRLAFVWEPPGGNPDVYIKTIGSEKLQQITSSPEPERSPAVSPDGHSILYVRIRGDRCSLALYDIKAGRERQLAETFSPHISFYGAPGPFVSWFPDSRRAVVVSRIRLPGPTVLFTLDIQTGKMDQLTNPASTTWGDSEPSVSPDGKAVLFSRSISPGFNNLYRIAADGRSEPELVLSNNRWNCGPVWMPDGRSFVYTSGYWGHVGLFRMMVGRPAEPHPLAVGESGFHATVSRDRQLAFMRHQIVQEIWRIPLNAPGRAAGGAMSVIASSRSELNADISPDSQWVVFASDRSGSYEIWIARADGTDPMQITNFGGPPAGSPRWSPDGTRIAFDAAFDGGRDICVIGRDGQNLRRLTSQPGSDVLPRWSRDGRFIYFASRRSGDYQIRRISAAGGTSVQITHDGGVVAEPSSDSRWLYYTKTDNNTNALYRAPLAGGAESLVIDAIFGRRFAVTGDGIYFQPGHESRPVFHFFDARSARVTHVAAAKDFQIGPLSVSPDGKYLYFTASGPAQADLMIVPALPD